MAASIDDEHHYSTSARIVVLVLIILVLIALAWVGWHVYQRFRARRLGLPTPSLNPFASSNNNNRIPSRNYPAPSGPLGWIKAKFNGLRNTRMAGGAYEASSTRAQGGSSGRRGFGALDPDEAWDTGVGTEADEYGPGGYYEEQELGLTNPHGYGLAGGLNDIPSVGDRGRGRDRSELDDRYDEEMGGGSGRTNPFGDTAERSDLRGVSPRPHGEAGPAKGHKKAKGSQDDSPTERKSMFTENV